MALTPVLVAGAQPGVQLGARTVLNNLVETMADATFKDVLTVTVPNTTSFGAVFLEVVGALGDSDSAHAVRVVVAISRIAGAATLAAIALTAGAATTGATANAAVTAGVTAMTGAVGATQTFTIQLKVTRSAGAAANHRTFIIADCHDPMMAGISIATI